MSIISLRPNQSSSGGGGGGEGGSFDPTPIYTELAKKANKSDIPDVSKFITSEALEGFVSESDLNGLATETYVDDKIENIPIYDDSNLQLQLNTKVESIDDDNNMGEYEELNLGTLAAAIQINKDAIGNIDIILNQILS